MMPELTPAGELPVTPGPHIWSGLSVARVMYIVVGALMLPVASALYFYRLQAALVILTSIVFSIATEFVSKKIRGQAFVMDGSALITGILLALVLPPGISLWMVAVGAIFAIGVVKEAFGGLGNNIFNPALASRAFMAASFASPMTTWVLPLSDGVTTATTLNTAFVFSERYTARMALYWDMFTGNRAGSLGETSAALILIGGVILIALKIIDWRIPLSYLLTVAVLSPLFGQDPLIQLMAGGLMLGAFFMATDYVTCPVTYWGRVIFGIGCGVVTMVIRLFGSLPEGVCYSILFMNAMTPLIEKYVRVRPFGYRKAVKNAA